MIVDETQSRPKYYWMLPPIVKYCDAGRKAGEKRMDLLQCCQMVYFQTKNIYLGKFWKVLKLKMLVFFMAILSTLRQNGIIDCHLVHFVVIWYIFYRFGKLYR
jgi:hypothetical protein